MSRLLGACGKVGKEGQPAPFGLRLHEARDIALAEMVADTVSTRLQSSLVRVEGKLDDLARQLQQSFTDPPQQLSAGQAHQVVNIRLSQPSAEAKSLAPSPPPSPLRVCDPGWRLTREELQEELRQSAQRFDAFLPHEAQPLLEDKSDNPAEVSQIRTWLGAWHRCRQAKEEPDGNLARCLHPGGHFMKLSMVVVLLNTIHIWYITNLLAAPDHLGRSLPMRLQLIDMCFLLYYAVEVALKLAVHRVWFFLNEDWVWNGMDLTLVGFGIAQVIMADVQHLHVSFLRSIRLFRIAKLLRIVRAVRCLRELRLMAACMIGSLVSLVWAMLFLFLTLMMAALVFVQSMTNFRMDHQHCDDDLCSQIPGLFGTVSGAMMTLFMSTTGGVDWGEVYEVVRYTGFTNSALFICYIVFFLLAFFNIITSMFVDKAVKLAKPDEDAMMLERHEEELEVARELRTLIEKVDKDQSGTISIEELEEAVMDSSIRHKFEMLGISIRHVRDFFATMRAVTNSEKLGIDSFVEGCMKMKGVASSLDVQVISWQVRELAKQVRLLSLSPEEEPPRSL